MTSMNHSKSIKAYNQVGVSDASYADPHRLICLLMNGALDRLSKVKGIMQQGTQNNRGEIIGSAITIIDGLKACLNEDVSEELSNNLADLYDYMCRRLLQANTENKVEIVDEVVSLLKEIKYAWEAIPQDVREQHNVESQAASAAHVS